MRRQQGALARAAALRTGRFRFLNHEICLPAPVDWRLADHADVDALWGFHLHYHEFLLDLLVEQLQAASASPPDTMWRLVKQWIAANPLSDPRTHGDAWHPFCISRRVPVWIVLWHAAPPPDDLAPVVLESLYRQAMFLSGNLERDLGGNHLLENARALALAGVFFEGSLPERWLNLARDLLTRELPVQILEHGEHFERSPMYHAQMVDALLDVRDATAELDPDLSRQCGIAASRMGTFLASILHPDGEIPLLGDSVLGEAPPARDLICAAVGNSACANHSSADASPSCRVGDYWVWRNDGDFILLDGGPVGTNHLPAHAHSDLSTIEVSVAGQRLIVDSGVFAYRDDDFRHYCRSTAAHNVLQIDQVEQCDTWSRFRMGYRGQPIALESGRTGDYHWARMRHNAYRRIGVPCVGRWVASRAGGATIIVDWALGRGSHAFTNWLHLHPDVEVIGVASKSVELRLGADTIQLGALGSGVLRLVEEDYFPEFGHRIRAPVVCWTSQGPLPFACGWWLTRCLAGGRAELGDSPFAGRAVRWSDPQGETETEWRDVEVFGV